MLPTTAATAIPTSSTCRPNTTYNLTNIDNNTSGSNGLPLISSTTTIVGNGSTIERTGSNAFRLFDVASDGSLTLLDMTLTGGLVQGPGVAADGGAIFSSGSLELNAVTVKSNKAVGLEGKPAGSAGGGGLYVAGGSLDLIDDTLSDNEAEGGVGSNGQYPASFNSASSVGWGGTGGNGTGGGLYVAAGSVRLTDDTVSGNIAEGGNGGHGAHGNNSSAGSGFIGGVGGNAFGGGLFVAGGKGLTFLSDTIAANTVQGGHGGQGGNGGVELAVGLSDRYSGSPGPGGNGGNAGGGGIYAQRGALALTNTLVAKDTLTAGSGGDGGTTANLGHGPSGSKGSSSGPDISGTVQSSDHDLDRQYRRLQCDHQHRRHPQSVVGRIGIARQQWWHIADDGAAVPAVRPSMPATTNASAGRL